MQHCRTVESAVQVLMRRWVQHRRPQEQVHHLRLSGFVAFVVALVHPLLLLLRTRMTMMNPLSLASASTVKLKRRFKSRCRNQSLLRHRRCRHHMFTITT
jgi:hypothetical protein